jgi:hypothetical protein
MALAGIFTMSSSAVQIRGDQVGVDGDLTLQVNGNTPSLWRELTCAPF